MDISTLYKQFLKGIAYFKKNWADGTITPPLLRQLDAFQRDVVNPLDEKCLKLTTNQRAALQEGLWE